MEEVNNLVDQPHIIECSFDKKSYLYKRDFGFNNAITSKVFSSFYKKNRDHQRVIVIANKKDNKGLIKIGNERVVKARLDDAEFFWNKDKSQN